MDLEVHQEAVGLCIVCNKDATGSLYWLGMTQTQWDIIRPLVAHLFAVSPWSGVRMVFNSLFIPGLCKPFCGSICSTKYKENDDDAN